MKQWILLVATIGLAAARASAASDASGYNAASVFDWKVRPQVGARYVMRTFSRTEMQIGGIPGASGRAGGKGNPVPTSMSINTQSSSVADYEVLGRDAQDATTIKLTYRTFGSGASGMTPGLSSSQLRAAQDKQSKMMNDIFVGSSLTMKIAPDGRVWSVLGLDKLRARMTRAFASMPGGGAALQMMGKNFLGPDFYKKALTQGLGTLPEHPIAPGESWAYQLSLPLPMGMSSGTQGTRTLVARRDGVATIKDSGTFNVTQNPATQPPPASSTAAPMPRMTMHLQGALNGSTLVDEASGLEREASTSMAMSGRITVEAQPAPAAPALAAPWGKPSARPASPPITMTLSARSTTRTVMEPVARRSS